MDRNFSITGNTQDGTDPDQALLALCARTLTFQEKFFEAASAAESAARVGRDETPALNAALMCWTEALQTLRETPARTLRGLAEKAERLSARAANNPDDLAEDADCPRQVDDIDVFVIRRDLAALAGLVR